MQNSNGETHSFIKLVTKDQGQQELITWDWMNWWGWLYFLRSLFETLWFFVLFSKILGKLFLFYAIQQIGKNTFLSKRWNIYLFLPVWSLYNSEIYSYFHGNTVICISSIRTCSPCNRTQLETLVILQRLTLECNIWECG